MRTYFFLNFAIYLVAPLIGSSSQAQTAFSNNESSNSYTPSSHSTGSGDHGTSSTNPTETVVLTGKITNPAGPLAGALDARVTYAGYADEKMTLNATTGESTVNLANARVIVVARKQQLKYYLKTARKEVKRSLKQVHG